MFSQKYRGISYYLFASLSVLAIACSLAEYFSSWHRYLEFTTNYKLQFLLMALCSLVYFALCRRKLWFFLSLSCVILNLAIILPWYFGEPEVATENQYAPLKVFSYNVLWKNKKYDEAIALVEAEQPDIAIFQEVYSDWHPELSALKSNYPYHIWAEKLEIEVYSKLPLNNPQIELYGTYRGLVIADVPVGDRAVKFIATHAYPQLYWGQGGWSIRNKHLKHGIGEYVSQLTQPAIVLGDLNVAMWSPYYREMIEISGLRNARQGRGVLPTHSIVAPQFAALSAPLDHCLVSSEVRVQDFKLGPAIGSDHLPIVAELLIPIEDS